MAGFEFDAEQIDRDIAETGFSVVTLPREFHDLCASARADYLDAFRRTAVQPPKRPFRPADLADGPWRKFAIGSKNGVGEAYAQLLQTIYFDHTRPPYAALNRLFGVVIELRNQMMRVAPAFGADPITDGYWNACRVHHYPRGGGFMMTHRDTYFPLKLGDLPFYQVMVPLSVKGRDFVEGGGIVINQRGERLNVDEIGGFGSLVIFDGRLQHGVDDVDPEEVMNFNDEGGRLAAFANLYVTRS